MTLRKERPGSSSDRPMIAHGIGMWLPLPLLLVLLIAGCGSYAPAGSADNLTYLYKPGNEVLLLQARVYHSSEERSMIYYKLRTKDLLYKSNGGGDPFRAHVRISYEAYPDLQSKQLLDSASTLVSDVSEGSDQEKELIGSMDVRRNANKSFVLRVTAHDLNRDAESTVVISVDRDAVGNRQNFIPLSGNGGIPLFDDHMTQAGPVKIMCERYAGDTLFASWYDQTFSLPAPVFAAQGAPTINAHADSTFIVVVDSSGRCELDIGEKGFYHLRADTTVTAGFTLFVLHDAYPGVNTARNMVPPLRYITSLQEYDGITTNPDKRKALERFWQDACGDRDRARDAIRTYYSRVESANLHFTSYVEGWKTDRGLVHIIFGTPNTIHRTERGESWVYGEETNLMSLTFNFTRRPGPFTDNDLVLDRDPVFKGAWYRNVESWRNGRIYQN